MAYYNPSNESDYDSAYNYQSDSGPGIMESLGSAAKMMAIMGALNIGGQSITKGISKSLGSAIKSNAKAPLHSIAKKMTEPSIGGILKRTSVGVGTRRLFRSTPIARAGAQRASYLKNFKIAHPDQHGVERIVSAFKNPKTLVAAVGGAWARNAVAGAGVAYAVDSMFGLTKDLGLEQKKWYDIPGQAGNALKWFGYESIYSTAFGGVAGPIAGAVGSIGKQAVAKAFGGKFGKSLVAGYSKMAKPGIPTETSFQKFFKGSVLSDAKSQQEKAFASRSAIKGLGLGRTVRESSSQINAAFRQLPGSIKEGLKYKGTAAQKIKKTAGPVIAAIKNARDIQIKNRSPRHQFSPAKYEGLRAVQFLDRLGNQATKGGKYQTKQDMTHFLKMMKPEFEKLEKKTVVDHAFKELKPLRNRDVIDQAVWSRIEGNLSSRYAKSHVQELVKTVQNMRVGKRVYRGYGDKIKGAGVDLSAFDPLLGARRGLEKLMNFQFNIPMSKSPLSLGALTRTSKYFAEAPSLEFFDKGPGFKIRGDSAKKYQGKGITSIGELSTDKDATYFYLNGKWGIFDSNGIETLDANSTLMYAAKNSVEKTGEMNSINATRLKVLGGVAAINKASDQASRGHQFTNKWLNLLQKKTGLGIPERAEHFLNAMTDKMKGKNHAYRLAATEVFGSEGFNVNPNALNTLEGVLGHSAQDFSRILKNKRGLEILGEESSNKYLTKDLFDNIMNNDRLLDAIRTRSTNDAEFWRYNPKAKEAFKMAEAFPKQAEDHISVKRLGPMSDMNSYDILRVGYIEDIFNKDFLQYKSGNGEPHGIISAIPKLVDEGIITEREAKSLRVHAELSSLRDKGLFAFTGEPGRDNIFRDLLGKIRTDKEWDARQIQGDIIDFVSNNDMRRPKIRVNQEKILGAGVPDFIHDSSPYFSTPNGLMGKAFGDTGYVSNIMESVTNMMQEFYPFRKDPIKQRGFLGSIDYVARGMATVGAGVLAYRTADYLFAANPLFNDTALDQGITGMVADSVAKGRLFTQRVSDLTGVTGAMKHLEGLLPGSTSTIPGIIAGLATSKIAGAGPLQAMKWMASGALINRIADPYLPDYSKGYEQLRDEYSGVKSVPFMKAPTWLLGGTPWEGTKVEGYTPNWYVKAKSRWKASETLYGSETRRLIHEPIPFLGFNIGDIVDPYYMERKHFFTRPYPTTGTALEEVPIIGAILGPTLGRLIKPKKTMHQEFLRGEERPQGNTEFAITPPSTQEGLALIGHTPGVRRTAGRSAFQGSFVYTGHKNSGQLIAQDFLERSSHLAGLQGFLGRSAVNKLVGDPLVLPTLESAGRMASMSRGYYDMNLGGMGFLTEGVRRLFHKPDYKKYGLNPIPNMMPNWLPSEYLSGDPYAKLMKGELRLPGQAFLQTHADVERSMPGRASMVGGNEEHLVQYFTGLLPPVLKKEYDIMDTGTAMHGIIQDHLAAEGLLIQAEALVFDAKNDISGHVDAIIRDGVGGKGRRAMEIKTISEEGFMNLDAPKYQHVGQLNFYLKQLNMKKGSFLYVNRDNPAQVKTFEIQYSQSRWEKDLKKLQSARQVAADMMQTNTGDTLGYSYSWLDRLEILADVAPSSKEFKEAKSLVEQQIKYQQLDERQLQKYKRILAMRQTRIRKYDLYPTRFKGQVMTPDTERNLQSLNDNIKAGAEYSMPERMVGAAWESFVNSNNFITNKFFAFKDPIQHYKQTRLYGKEYKPWDEPINSFIEPYSRGLISKTDPISGGVSWGTGGYLLGGGPIGGILGGLIGSIWGTGHGLWRKATNSTYIPTMINDQREIEQYFDRAKYARFNRLADLTDGLTKQGFIDERNATMTSVLKGEGNMGNFFQATPFREKPYIESFLNTRNAKRRKEILGILPDDVAMSLQGQWAKTDEAFNTSDYNNKNSEFLSSSRKMPSFNKQIFDPSVALEDIKLKTIDEAGYDSHEFGLGWNQQMLRLQENYDRIQTEDYNHYNGDRGLETPNISSAQVRGVINNLFSNAGIRASSNVYINNSDDENMINVQIRRDRSNTIMNAIRNRSYVGG